jgi:hypothetical protein
MALINTEEAAKRLARVILSDIELYRRERPQEGEDLATQIEEGRRLFGSRVTPAIMPLFDVVLADRGATSEKTPVVVQRSPAAVPTTNTRAAPTVSTPAAPTVSTRAAPTVSTRAAPTASTPAVSTISTRAAPTARAPARAMAGPPAERISGPPAEPVVAMNSLKNDTPSPRPIVYGRAGERMPPAPVQAAAPLSAVTTRVPSSTSIASVAREVEMPVPVLTSRISIPKLLAVAAVVVATFVFLGRFVR